MKMSGRVEGLRRSIRALGTAKSRAAIKINDGIEKCCGVILRKSLFYVPRDTGDLASTGKVFITGKGFGTRGEISFGGLAASGKEVDYAVVVHEDMEAKHDPPTCAKFLERGYRETRGTCTSILKRDLEML